MDDILTRHGFKVAVMKADAVAPDRREAWVADRVKEGVDVVICHPRLVQTGLDLIDFPTLVWFETDYSVYTMRQASRRSWRIGQRHPVKVIYMAYRGTLQADALKLVAKKLQSSLAVEGELPEDGLAAYGDDGDDLMMALARQVVSGDAQEDTETLEAVFAQARDAEAAAEEFLVDDGWQAVETGRRSLSRWRWKSTSTGTASRPLHAPGSGGVGPGQRTPRRKRHSLLSTGNGTNGNGHHTNPPKGSSPSSPGPSSWPTNRRGPSGRNGKPKTASASLFQWALDKEQEEEREKEPVGAGR